MILIRRQLVQGLVKILAPGWTLVAPAYEEVENVNTIVSCGGGPERVIGQEWDNPNWWFNRASNCVAIAKWLEKNGA